MPCVKFTAIEMEPWLKISLLLCIFGFLKEIRPSEPYIYDFLIGPWRNVTDTEVSQEVYPVGTYANMILLVFVFLITDMCRYKPLIIVLGMCGMVIWGMLLWTTSLFELQIVEVFYGMFMASEVAYYTYIYAKVDKEHYQLVTSHTRGAILAGRAISGATSQTLVSLDVMDFKQLNYITFASVSAATVWAIFLPSVKQSVYFHREQAPLPEIAENGTGALPIEKEPGAPEPIPAGLPFSQKVLSAFKLMKTHFIRAYSSLYVVKWSLWWALSSCGYVQVENYMQPLYSAIQDNTDAAYNGAVEAILTLLGFLAALLAGYLKVNWEVHGEVTLACFSMIQGALIVVCSQTTEIFICYSFYTIFGIIFHFMVTIASAQVAKKIDEDSYGLIFGINTFVALVFNSILTALVATKGIGFHLGARDQFIVYGSYHVAISVIFIAMGVRTYVLNRKTRSESSLVASKPTY